MDKPGDLGPTMQLLAMAHAPRDIVKALVGVLPDNKKMEVWDAANAALHILVLESIATGDILEVIGRNNNKFAAQYGDPQHELAPGVTHQQVYETLMGWDFDHVLEISSEAIHEERQRIADHIGAQNLTRIKVGEHNDDG